MKSPAEFGLPYPSWRPGQRRAIRRIQYPSHKFVVIQAPTGTGKTGIAGGAMRINHGRSVVLTATKALQDQYKVTAPWLTDIRGMANYPCHAARDEFKTYFPMRSSRVTCDEGPCKLNVQCTLKEHGCAYFDAFRGAINSSYVNTSYAYWLATRRYGRGLGHVNLLICDEVHDAAAQIGSAYQIRIPKKELHGTVPCDIDQWKTWANAQLQQMGQEHGDLLGRLRMRTRAERYEQLTRMTPGWAVDSEGDAHVFEPVDVRSYGHLLYGGVERIALMSATITPRTVTMLGIHPDDVDFHEVPMSFDVARRPVYILPGGRIDYRANHNTIARWLETIDWILKSRDDRKGIIHTVSYDRQRTILQHSVYRHQMIAPRFAAELPAAIDRFRRAGPGAILISPSVVTGFDFPYDTAEFQILTKVPFPNTRSPIAKARVKRIPHYREIVTAQQIQQATGRVMRAADDRGETFIIDEHFTWFVKSARDFFAEWFLEAVTFTRRMPPRPPLVRAA
jgi:ATP-dependent DNA helicase DinG